MLSSYYFCSERISINCFTINLVPLQKPSCKFKFLININIAPIFKINLRGGSPFGVNEFKNSFGISQSDPSMPSILKYSLLLHLNVSEFHY